MADTTTTNYGLVKPEVGASNDSWGNKTNGNWDVLDAAVKAIANTAAGAMPTSGGTFTGGIGGTTAAFSGAITQGGNQVWHAGNFAPSSYASLSGATFSGPVGRDAQFYLDVNVNPRLNLDNNDYLLYDRANDRFAVVIAGSPRQITSSTGTDFAGTLSQAGNQVWHAGNFSPSSYQSALGYTPVQQGGGANQGTNKIYLGWTGSRISAQVDGTDLGAIATQTVIAAGVLAGNFNVLQRAGNAVWDAGNFSPSSYAPLAGATFSGNIGAPRLYSNDSGNGQNVAIGDDVWLGDINVPHTMSVRGQADPTSGFIRFGSASAGLGVSGGGALTYGGSAIWHAGNFSPSTYAPLSGASFSGTVTAPSLNADGQAYLTVSGGNTVLNFDNGDFLAYYRSTNKWVWGVGNTAIASLDSSGNLRLAGTVIINTTP